MTPKPATRGLPTHAVYVLGCTGLAGGIAVVTFAHPFWGLALVGTSLLATAAGRLLLSPRACGLLVVRGRTADACMLAALGLAILVLALLLH